MADITYLDKQQVADVRQSKAPANYNRDGYGSKIASSWEIKVGNRWHRVYIIQYSNMGTAYILIGGVRVLLGSFDPARFAGTHGNHGRY